MRMKIDNKSLKRIIREELVLYEQSQQSLVAQEASLLGDLNDILANIEEVANELYGLQDPGDPGIPAGDEMAQAIELQLARANDLYRAFEKYFEDRDVTDGRL